MTFSNAGFWSSPVLRRTRASDRLTSSPGVAQAEVRARTPAKDEVVACAGRLALIEPLVGRSIGIKRHAVSGADEAMSP